MNNIQPGILAPIPKFASYLFFHALPNADLPAALLRLRSLADGSRVVVGLGQSLVLALGRAIDGLHDFPSYALPGCDIPATPSALCCWLREDERGELIHLSRAVEQALAGAFVLQQQVEAFKYKTGLDLTGYEDGTENPVGDAAQTTAIVSGQGAGLDGGSFVALQQWLHDMPTFEAMSGQAQDHAIGRRKSDNEELDDAPESAHVKRTAQESFAPEAFVLRRSMPWASGAQAGFMFSAFGCSVDAFEAQLKRMVGAEDGIVDGLFQFTRPLTGSYFWCPPLLDGQLDLRAVGL
jgi:putative iron-dependent peroxidase